MPITKSAIKKAKQDERSRVHNREIRDAYKKAVKEVRKTAEAGDLKKAATLLPKAFSEIDKAAKRKIIHKNNASRRKARLSKLIAAPKTEKKTKEEKK